jgi:hypothetical protein
VNTTPFSTLHVTSTTAAGQPESDQDQPQAGATRRVRATGGRALVLGGGGSAGNAWLTGVIAGLLDAGLDVTEAAPAADWSARIRRRTRSHGAGGRPYPEDERDHRRR